MLCNQIDCIGKVFCDMWCTLSVLTFLAPLLHWWCEVGGMMCKCTLFPLQTTSSKTWKCEQWRSSLNLVLLKLDVSLNQGQADSKKSVGVELVQCVVGNLHSISGADAQEACLEKVEKH